MRLYTHTHTHTNVLNNKGGITLVALVVTIVVLLILAGVSVKLVLGQNGLIKQAQEAKKKTHEESIKEQIDMALASYKIENANKENSTDDSTGSVENFEIIEENPCKDIKFIAKADNKIIIMKNDGTSIITKENLVRNGFGTSGNDNFPGVNVNNGEFTISAQGNKLILCSDFIEVDPNKKYYQSIVAKVNNMQSVNYIGLMCYDVDKNIIDDNVWMYTKDTLTYLKKDLKYGDTEIYFNDISGFIKENVAYQNKGLIFWNYKDSTGYQYPELTYSRNSYYSLFEEDGIDIENNKITLNKPWQYDTIPANTKVSQSNKGSNYNYGLASDRMLTSKYKWYDNTISGINNTGHSNFKKFNPGTKYVKIMIIGNYRNSVDKCELNFKDIIFSEIE